MAAAKLAWSTPSGGLLWEFWGHHKRNLMWPVLALAAGWLFGRYAAGDAPLMVTPLLVVLVLVAFIASFCALLIWLSYLEVDPRTLQFGYPSRLLLKPVSTAHLVLVPMFFGGLVVMAYLLAWDWFLLQPLSRSRAWEEIPALNAPWLVAVALSFFWWLLAVGWSTAWRQVQPLLLLLVAAVHMLVWSLPQSSDAISSRGRWLLVSVMMVASLPAAVMGLRSARHGGLSAPFRWSLFWSRARSGRIPRAPGRFHSALGAQCWFEWRRFGLVLPSVAVTLYFVILPLVKLTMVWQGNNQDFGSLAAGTILCTPLLLALVMGTGLGEFDPAQAAGGLPVFISARPITNGGLVLAKVIVALAVSALTWLVAAAAAVFWVVMTGPGVVLAKLGIGSGYDLGRFLLGLVPLFWLLVLVTWKYFLGGLGAGLSGRRWISIGLQVWRMALGVGAFALYIAIKSNSGVGAWLVRWATVLLLLGLAGKVALAAAAFAAGWRRKAITGGVIVAIVTGWCVCGTFVAGYAGLVCWTLRRPDLWPWIVLAGFQVLPLADLAIAPLALCWNRHR